jgi:hypothetical protein
MRKLLMLALVAVLGVASIGCGSSKSKTSAEAKASTTTTSSSSKSGSGGDSGSSASDGSGNGGKTSTSTCLAASLAFTKLLASAGGAAGASPDQANQLQQQADTLGAEIPSSLKGDFKTVSDALNQFAAALKSGGSDIGKATEKLDSPEVKKAQTNIQDYFKNNCPS